MSVLLLQDGSKLLLQDGSSNLLLQDGASGGGGVIDTSVSGYIEDIKYKCLKNYAINHAEAGKDIADLEFFWWKNDRSKVAIPWGDDRKTAITAAATAHSITLSSVSPWGREAEFWNAYTPVALP